MGCLVGGHLLYKATQWKQVMNTHSSTLVFTFIIIAVTRYHEQGKLKAHSSRNYAHRARESWQQAAGLVAGAAENSHHQLETEKMNWEWYVALKLQRLPTVTHFL